MAVCNFCHKEFGNAQAVRAHLKGCGAYKAKHLTQSPSGSPGSQGNAYTDAQGLPSAEFDPVRDIQQRVTAERLRLKLREIERAHSALDEETASRQAKEADLQAQRRARALAEKRDQEALRQKEEAAVRARSEAKRRQEQLHAQRRRVIQEVKNEVMDWWALRYSTDSELKARILREIETELTPLPVHELPKAEVLQIAEAVRDRLHNEHCQIKKAKERQTQQRESLIRAGMAYVSRELQGIDRLDPLERLRIEMATRQRLSALTGSEARAQVRGLVDEILDDEGFGVIDDEGDE